jgi:3-oxoacyl-[acyl-carrier-protein] synthase-1
MAKAHDIGIYRAGMVSCLGLTTERHAALAYADISGVAQVSQPPGGLDPMDAGFVALPVLPALRPATPASIPGTYAQRLIRLLDPALDEALSTARWPALFLALPQYPEMAQQGGPEQFLQTLHRQGEGAFDLAHSAVVAGDRTAFFSVLQTAAAYAQRHQCWVAAAAVDSFYSADRLTALYGQQRLARPGAADGLVPSEGAAVVLLAPMSFASSSVVPWARLGTLCFGREPGHLGSGRPCRGEGLSACVSEACSGLSLADGPVAAMYSGHNGEYAGAREWAIVRLRLQKQFAADATQMAIADVVGDTGVAAGALQVALAAAQLQQGQVSGPALTWASDDNSARAAATLLQTPAAPKSSSHTDAALARAQQPRAARNWHRQGTRLCFDKMAYLYLAWRTGCSTLPWRAAFDPHIGPRLQRLCRAVATDPLAVEVATDAMAGGDPEYAYAALRAVLAGGGPWSGVVAVLSVNMPTRPLEVMAVVDALAHGWRPSLATDAVTWLSQRPQGLHLLSQLAQRCPIPGAVAAVAVGLRNRDVPQLAATKALVANPHERDRALLTLQLNRSDRRVRRAAAIGLLHLGARVQVFAIAPDPCLTPWVWALTAGPEAYGRLAEAVRLQPTAHNILALGLMGCPQGVSVLLTCRQTVWQRRWAELGLWLITGVAGHADATSRLWDTPAVQALTPNRRYRAGRLVTPEFLLAMQRETALPPLLRYLFGLELNLRYGVAVPLGSRSMAPAGSACLTAPYDAMAIGRGYEAGRWYYQGHYKG